MEPRHCPYLGLIDDPTIYEDFPYEGNACHRVKKPVKVALEYQKTHCLCDAYQDCSGYAKGWEEGFPLELRADYDPSKKNLFQSILFWKRAQQRKLAQKKEQRAERDWKETLQSKLSLKKKPQTEKDQPEVLQTKGPEEEQKPVKEKKEKIPPEEPAVKKTEEIKQAVGEELQDKTQEKIILKDEAALEEYLQSKRKFKNPLLSILPWKIKQQEKPDDSSTLEDERASKKEKRPKGHWKNIFLPILFWKNKPQVDQAAKKEPQPEPVSKKAQKPKRSFKQVLQNLIPWKKSDRIKEDRKKAIQDEFSLEEKEQIIRDSVQEIPEDKPLTGDDHPLIEEEKAEERPSEAIPEKQPQIEEEQPKVEKPEPLPNEWVKEEAVNGFQNTEVNIRDELARRKKQKNKVSLKQKLITLFSWEKRKPSEPARKTEPQIKADKIAVPKDEIAWREERQANADWKKVFKNKRVWLVSLGIVLIFLLVVFIPQLPSLDLNLGERLQGIINRPVSATEELNPNIIPEDATQTEAPTTAMTEQPSNTPNGQNTPINTATPTRTSTMIPTATPSPGSTPGVIPFIYLTETETP